VQGDEIPRLIDELPLVAVAGPWRLREQLCEMQGVAGKGIGPNRNYDPKPCRYELDVTERLDGWTIRGPARIHAKAAIESLGDPIALQWR